MKEAERLGMEEINYFSSIDIESMPEQNEADEMSP
jgi:hypothetical protein